MKEKNFFTSRQPFTINGISFEEPTIDMLVPDIDNLEQHIMIQPAAVAYFGALYKTALNEYEDIKRKWKLRWNEMYDVASRNLQSKKATIHDIEVKAESLFKSEIENWFKKMREAKEKADLLECFWEGWKQKGFSINNYVALAVEGFVSRDVIHLDEEKKAKLRKATEIINRKV